MDVKNLCNQKDSGQENVAEILYQKRVWVAELITWLKCSILECKHLFIGRISYSSAGVMSRVPFPEINCRAEWIYLNGCVLVTGERLLTSNALAEARSSSIRLELFLPEVLLVFQLWSSMVKHPSLISLSTLIILKGKTVFLKKVIRIIVCSMVFLFLLEDINNVYSRSVFLAEIFLAHF